ncbi:MAG: ABC transporter permease [Phycisphaeraceae bacterium]|nr:ABC transporter permease [Phycisphaeraceae bacterium]
MTDLRLVLKSLSARSTSTVVTCLLIAIAVALLISMRSLREAGRRSFTRGVGNAHLVVSGDSSPLVAVLNGIFYANPPRAPLPESKVTEIASSMPWAWTIPTQLGDSFRGVPVLGTPPAFLDDFEPAIGEPWRIRRPGRNMEGPFDVVLGSRVAAATGLGVGDRLFLTHGMGVDAAGGEVGIVDDPSATVEAEGDPHDGHDHDDHGDHDGHDHDHGHVHADGSPHVHEEATFEVVGVLEPSGTHHDRLLVTSIEGSWFLHAIDRWEAAGRGLPETVDDLDAEDRLVTGMLLRTPVRAGRNSAAILQSAFDRLRRDPSITVASPATQVDRLFGIVASLDAVFIALGIGILVSGAISVTLVLWNSMELRRRQIAVLRVLGCTRGRVLGLVLTESAMIGVVGAVLGVGFAFAGARVAAEVLASRTGVVILPTIDADSSILIVAGTVVLAAFAGVAPAVRAYRTPVAEHLRPLD